MRKNYRKSPKKHNFEVSRIYFLKRNLNIWIWYDQKGRRNPQPTNFYPGVPGATVVPVVTPTVITPGPAIIS